MIRHARAFGAFWYDFVVGDDWRVAAGVVVALALTYVLSRSTAAPTWCVVIGVVGMLLAFSIRRATRR